MFPLLFRPSLFKAVRTSSIVNTSKPLPRIQARLCEPLHQSVQCTGKMFKGMNNYDDQDYRELEERLCV